MTVENIPDPNDFTKEIEGTIDNLFNPTKKIVIDPLTNEIKEVEEENILSECKETKSESDKEENHQDDIKQIEILSEDKQDELLLVSDAEKSTSNDTKEEYLKTEEHILELEPEVADINDKIDQSDETDEELEFELELENEETSDSIEVEEDRSYTNETIKLTEKLEQVVLTVEWEITPKLIEEALKIVKQLKNDISEDQIEPLEILNLMEELLEYLLIDPHRLPTNTPIILKRGVKTLKNVLDNPDERSNTEIKKAISELKDILDSYKSNANETDIDNKEQLHKELNKKIDKDIPDKQIDNRVKDLLLKTLEKHLTVLDDCIDKIIPIEQTLARAKETEKLYLFHKTLREELENQYNYIVTNLQKFDLLPKQFSKKKKRTYISKPIENLIEDKKASCPWNRVLGINWNDRFSAIPPNVDIVYNGPIPRKAKNQVKTSNNLELSKFKTWPWTKIKSMFSGKLSQKTEEELKSTIIPIIDNPAASKLFGTERSGTHLIIIDTPKGLCALVTSGPPQEIPGPFEENWVAEKGKDNPITGYIKQGEQKIPVIEIEKLIK